MCPLSLWPGETEFQKTPPQRSPRSKPPSPTTSEDASSRSSCASQAFMQPTDRPFPRIHTTQAAPHQKVPVTTVVLASQGGLASEHQQKRLASLRHRRTTQDIHSTHSTHPLVAAAPVLRHSCLLRSGLRAGRGHLAAGSSFSNFSTCFSLHPSLLPSPFPPSPPSC